jgi:hypothetical protein
VEAAQFLDEFRPFRRGELALARRVQDDPIFLPPRELDLLRYALRLGQISSIDGCERDALVDRIGFARLRLLQLLAPALPTDPARIDAGALYELVPRVSPLVEGARRNILDSGLASEEALDAEVSSKRLALVLGGAAGSAYVYLGALQRLADLRLEPSYLVGCSMGSILAVIRGRERRFDVDELFDELRLLSARAAFRAPTPASRYGLPAALRLELRGAIGAAFTSPDGDDLRLRDLEIPVDTLATGIGAGALGRPPEEYARLIGAEVASAAGLAELRGGALARAVSALVSLAMSRRMLVPIVFGRDSGTAELPALDAAGFSAAIPAFLHYDLEAKSTILEGLFKQHDLVSLVDGALASAIPARYAWEAIEAGRIGARNCAIVALDALAARGGMSSALRPILRVISATAERDKPYWDLCVRFRRRRMASAASRRPPAYFRRSWRASRAGGSSRRAPRAEPVRDPEGPLRPVVAVRVEVEVQVRWPLVRRLEAVRPLEVDLEARVGRIGPGRGAAGQALAHGLRVAAGLDQGGAHPALRGPGAGGVAQRPRRERRVQDRDAPGVEDRKRALEQPRVDAPGHLAGVERTRLHPGGPLQRPQPRQVLPNPVGGDHHPPDPIGEARGDRRLARPHAPADQDQLAARVPGQRLDGQVQVCARARARPSPLCAGDLGLPGGHGGHLGPDRGPVAREEVHDGVQVEVVRVARIGAEEPLGQVAAPAIGEVHGQERDLRRGVDAPQRARELQAVDDQRRAPLALEPDVLEVEVAVTVDRAALREAPDEGLPQARELAPRARVERADVGVLRPPLAGRGQGRAVREGGLGDPGDPALGIEARRRLEPDPLVERRDLLRDAVEVIGSERSRVEEAQRVAPRGKAPHDHAVLRRPAVRSRPGQLLGDRSHPQAARVREERGDPEVHVGSETPVQAHLSEAVLVPLVARAEVDEAQRSASRSPAGMSSRAFIRPLTPRGAVDRAPPAARGDSSDGRSGTRGAAQSSSLRIR